MNILALSSHDPNDVANGIGLVVYNSVRCLVSLGHHVELGLIVNEGDGGSEISYAQCRSTHSPLIQAVRAHRKINPKLDALRALAGSALSRVASGRAFLNGPEKQFGREIAQRSRGRDLAIWFGHLWDPLTLEVASVCECPVILHVSDSITLSRRQRSTNLPGRIQSAMAQSQEASIINRAKNGCIGIVYVAEADRQSALAIAKPRSAGSVFCLPLAVDTDIFAPGVGMKRSSRVPVVLFTGAMDFGPNVSAATRLVRHVLPFLPKTIEIRLVGKNPGAAMSVLAEADSRVRVTGEVHDIAAEYRAADIFLAPMTPSSGMKNKVLEAMACALPVVASPDAISGFDGIPPGILVGETDAHLAALAGKLLGDDEMRRNIGDAGRKFILEHHGWTDRTRRLACLLSVQPEFAH